MINKQNESDSYFAKSLGFIISISIFASSGIISTAPSVNQTSSTFS